MFHNLFIIALIILLVWSAYSLYVLYAKIVPALSQRKVGLNPWQKPFETLEEADRYAESMRTASS